MHTFGMQHNSRLIVVFVAMHAGGKQNVSTEVFDIIRKTREYVVSTDVAVLALYYLLDIKSTSREGWIDNMNILDNNSLVTWILGGNVDDLDAMIKIRDSFFEYDVEQSLHYTKIPKNLQQYRPTHPDIPQEKTKPQSSSSSSSTTAKKQTVTIPSQYHFHLVLLCLSLCLFVCIVVCMCVSCIHVCDAVGSDVM
jgi:hypothetical protein